MTLERTLKKLYRKNTPIIACEFSLEQYALGLTQGIDIKYGNKWYYNIKPPMRHYEHYVFIASPKREKEIYERMVTRYHLLDEAAIIKAI